MTFFLTRYINLIETDGSKLFEEEKYILVVFSYAYFPSDFPLSTPLVATNMLAK